MAGVGDRTAIINQAVRHLPAKSLWRERLRAAMPAITEVGLHLAVMVEPFLEAILDGRKTIESRFALNRTPPFERVQSGDIILLKRSGGPVVGLAVAGAAQYFELNESVLSRLRNQFSTQLLADNDEFWRLRANKKFASLINIDEAVQIDMMRVDKRDRRGWISYDRTLIKCRQIRRP